MRIMYVAKHDQPNNDDEGAITYALNALGHDVQRVRESMGRNAWKMRCDLCLFHKWEDIGAISKIRCPMVFWYFDLVDYPDPTLQDRCQRRINWMKRTTPLVDLGFCTDGDWVKKDQSGKLVWLTQGADGRITGRITRAEQPIDILFTGIENGGTQRASFVAEMRERYGSRFVHHRSGYYREKMANLIASSKIVVAPDGPVTDRYWSNRIYNVLGFGGCLIHPLCHGLWKQGYIGGTHYLTYETRDELHMHIDSLLRDRDVRTFLSTNGLNQTMKSNLYRHRCEELIRTVQERLGI